MNPQWKDLGPGRMQVVAKQLAGHPEALAEGSLWDLTQLRKRESSPKGSERQAFEGQGEEGLFARN